MMFDSFFQRRSRRNQVVCRLETLESRTVLSVINVISTPGPSGSVDLKFLGTTGDDAVAIFMDADMKISVAGNTGDSFKVNGGPEQSSLSFDGLNNVTMNLGAGNDSCSISNVSINQFLLHDGATVDETNRYSLGDVEITRVDAYFNLGVAEFTVQINSGESMSLESLAVHLKETTSSKVILESFSSSTMLIEGQFNVHAGSQSQSSDLVIVRALPDTAADGTQISFQNGIRVNLGGGKDTFQMIGNIDVDEPTFIASGNGDDQIVLGNIPDQGSIVFRGIVSILTGEGFDSVECGNSFESDDRVRFRNRVAISTGNQQDNVDIRKSTFEKSLKVDVGSNALSTTSDGVHVKNIQVMGPAFFRSTGSANINIEAVTDSTTPSRFRNTVAFALQSGRVTIGNELQTTPKVVFADAQVFIGTDATISVRIAGPILANPAKRRLIRAILES